MNAVLLDILGIVIIGAGVAIVSAGLAYARKGLKWLGVKINATEIGSKLSIDDAILRVADVVIVKLKAKVDALKASGRWEDDKNLASQFQSQAYFIIKNVGLPGLEDILRTMTEAEVRKLIDHAVDRAKALGAPTE